MVKERDFLMNLKHLSGPTDAVTVDYMLTAIMFINRHSIEECHSLWQNIRAIFNDKFWKISRNPNNFY